MKFGKLAVTVLTSAALIHGPFAQSVAADRPLAGELPEFQLFPPPTPASEGDLLALGGLTTLRNLQTQSMLIRRVATEQERRAALNNGRKYYSGLSEKEKEGLKKKKIRYLAVNPTAAGKVTPPVKSKSKSEVVTKPDTNTKTAKTGQKPKAAESTPPPKPEQKAPADADVMIYDPLEDVVVNKFVYTLPKVPRAKEALFIDAYEALYVGR